MAQPVETGKIKELETKASQNFDFDKLVDSAAKESAEREKRSRNFLVHRLPELPHLNPDDSMKDDRKSEFACKQSGAKY